MIWFPVFFKTLQWWSATEQIIGKLKRIPKGIFHLVNNLFCGQVQCERKLWRMQREGGREVSWYNVQLHHPFQTFLDFFLKSFIYLLDYFHFLSELKGIWIKCLAARSQQSTPQTICLSVHPMEMLRKWVFSCNLRKDTGTCIPGGQRAFWGFGTTAGQMSAPVRENHRLLWLPFLSGWPIRWMK